MQLPDGSHLSYIVDHGSKYWPKRRIRLHPQPNIYVKAGDEKGGTDWEVFIVDGDPSVSVGGMRLNAVDDSWCAFVQAPELFTELATLDGDADLDDVREILDRLGAVDETERP